MNSKIESATEIRQKIIKRTRRVVIKVGTRLLTPGSTASKKARVHQLVKEIARLRESGLEIILVSSGAIGAGMQVLNVSTRPVQVPRLQALAAVGQTRLMFHYETAALEHGFHCAQVLLCADDVRHRERHLNTAFCMDTLLSDNVLPIVNENDSVSVEEIKFGDNDRLAALVAMLVRADLTIFLTSVNGVHKLKGSEWGPRISVISDFTPKIRAMARDTETPTESKGGMSSKLESAELLTKAGEAAWISDGHDFSVLQSIFAGEDIGTLCLPRGNTRMSSHKRYLAFFSPPSGNVIVDNGAVKALKKPAGASLLPKGAVRCEGTFRRGDTVRILNLNGEEIGRGVTNYSFTELEKIKGLHTREINTILETESYDCVVHRNYMVLTETTEGSIKNPKRLGDKE